MGNENANAYRMYEMVIKDGENAYVVNRIALNEEDIKRRYGGNGEFVRIQDVTEEFPISEKGLRNALAVKFGDTEVEAIVHLLISGYANVMT
jgi:hypothetical protein